MARKRDDGATRYNRPMSMNAADRRIPPAEHDPWLNRPDAAAHLGVHPRTLDFYTQTGRVKCGFTPRGTRRWRLSDLDAANLPAE